MPISTNKDEETVPCKVCGHKTDITGAELCNGCYEMDKGFEFLKGRSLDKAKAWLQAQLDSLNSGRVS